MGQFYIEDYIWLIVIGIFVFFVIVGYVADKTGLARKTFGKTTSGNNKKLHLNEQNEVVQVVPVFETDNTVTPVMNSDDAETSVVEPVSNEIVEPEADNLYLSDDAIYSSSSEDTSNDTNELYLNDQNIVVDLDSASDDNPLPEENTEEDLYQPLGDVTFDTNESEEEHEEITPEDQDDVWQLDDNATTEENDDALVLPNLDELTAESDEDVWKF